LDIVSSSGFSDPSFHGQQNRSKLYFFDGIINTNVRGPTYIVIPNLDLVQEFKVVGHDAKAEFGGASGGVMNMVSKSGGNRFHGSAFEFVRNDAFDARNSFDVCTPARCAPGQLVPSEPAPFRQNQFGASLTGPSALTPTVPRSGSVAVAQTLPPSPVGVSFVSRLQLSGVSSAVAKLSFTATGRSSTGEMVRVTTAVHQSPSASETEYANESLTV
jgi:hypothetical protein